MERHLYLMRHGETLFNTQGRVQGACDSPLTENGISQTRLAKTFFEKENIQFDAVYSSTQERATDTARLISDSDKIIQLKGLKEMSFGEFEAQPEFLLPKFREGANSYEDLLVPFGGEDIRQVGIRVNQSMKHVLTESEDKNAILMVSHGAAMWGFILDMGISFPKGVHFSNCAICDFIITDDTLKLNRLILPTQDFKEYAF